MAQPFRYQYLNCCSDGLVSPPLPSGGASSAPTSASPAAMALSSQFKLPEKQNIFAGQTFWLQGAQALSGHLGFLLIRGWAHGLKLQRADTKTVLPYFTLFYFHLPIAPEARARSRRERSARLSDPPLVSLSLHWTKSSQKPRWGSGESGSWCSHHLRSHQ